MELTRKRLNELIKIHNDIKNPLTAEIARLKFSKWIIKAKIDFISEDKIPQGPLCMCCGKPIRVCGGCDGTC